MQGIAAAKTSVDSSNTEANLLVTAKIDRRPTAVNYRRGKLQALPEYNPDIYKNWQMDLRSYDLSKLDLQNSTKALMLADFDDRTTWPAADRMPETFDPKQISTLGKNPGLGIRSLHKKGITGKGVGVAIIDLPMLVDHQEYTGRLRLYEESNVFMKGQSEMHGPAVASFAVGKTVGVAPQADLYFIAAYPGDWNLQKKGQNAFEYNFKHIAVAIDRILEINKTLPHTRRIRVLSISMGWSPGQVGYEEVQAAAKRATDGGMLVVCSSMEDVHGFMFHGLGREPQAAPDDFSVYKPGAFWANQFHPSQPRNQLLVPMDCRTAASPTEQDEYVFYRDGGLSWAIPYIAGMYALACDVDPDITPQRFWVLAMKTGREIAIDHKGKEVPFGPILDPAKLIESIKSDELADEAAINAELAKYRNTFVFENSDAFKINLNEKVARLDLTNSQPEREDVIKEFGKPIYYGWGQVRFEASNRPDRYLMFYPSNTKVLINGEKVSEIRFHTPGYVFLEKIQIGSTLDEVLEVLPRPSRTVTGEKNEWEDGVLYRDIDGQAGVCYYARSDKAVRMFFMNNRVSGLYIRCSN